MKKNSINNGWCLKWRTKKIYKSTSGTFVHSFDDVLERSKSIDGATSNKTVWQFLHGVFDNEETMKEFLDEMKKCWGIDFDYENSYGFIGSLFNHALRHESCKINSETNKACGKVMQKEAGEDKKVALVEKNGMKRGKSSFSKKCLWNFRKESVKNESVIFFQES